MPYSCLQALWIIPIRSGKFRNYICST
jgi:hypothetical protein